MASVEVVVVDADVLIPILSCDFLLTGLDLAVYELAVSPSYQRSAPASSAQRRTPEVVGGERRPISAPAISAGSRRSKCHPGEHGGKTDKTTNDHRRARHPYGTLVSEIRCEMARANMSADDPIVDDPAAQEVELSTAVRNWIAKVFGDRNPAALAVLDIGIETGLDRHLALTTSMHDLVFMAKPAPSQDGAIIVRSPGSQRSARDGWVRIETTNSWKKNTVIERPASEAVSLFLRFIRETFGITIETSPGPTRQPLARFREDEAVLAEIGRELQRQAKVAEVRIPKALADQAKAAWARDETETIPDETAAEREVRHRAGTLALIGLSIQERARLDGDSYIVELDSWQIGDALNAADDRIH
jgi:hypothetical protein